MAKYVVHQEFPPELWADTAVDFTHVMKTILGHQLWRKCITPVAGAEIDVQLSDDMFRRGWGAGRAVVEVEGDAPQA